MPRRPNSSTEEIIITTLTLIAEHDVEGVSIDMIAEKAGVSKTTIYRRWPSRADLIVQAMTFLPRPDSNPDTGTLREDIEALLKGLVEFLNRRDGGKVFSALVNAAIRNEKLEKLRNEISISARADYERVIKRAISRGEIHKSVNVRFVTDLLIAPFIYRRMIEHKAARASDIKPVIETVLALHWKT